MDSRVPPAPMPDPPPEPPAVAAGGAEAPHLTREMLRGGVLADMIAKTMPGVRVLTDADRRESIAAMLAERPEASAEGLWVFAYGSLLWNPTVHVVGRRAARVAGWHRAFCLRTRAGRGTPDTPGLLLGLRRGGACEGAVLRVAAAGLEAELDLLWRREMVTASYTPRWLDVTDAEGQAFGHAIAFTIDEHSPAYADLPEAQVVRLLATARGQLGSCADYLFRTRDGLRDLGIRDAELERIARRVALWIETGADDPADQSLS